MHGVRESIFDLIMMDGELAELHVREKKGAEPLTEKDKRTAEEFIRKYHKNIIDKWVKFLDEPSASRLLRLEAERLQHEHQEETIRGGNNVLRDFTSSRPRMRATSVSA